MFGPASVRMDTMFTRVGLRQPESQISIQVPSFEAGQGRAAARRHRGTSAELRDASVSADVDARPALRVGFGLPQHFTRHRSGVAFPEREELQQVGDGISLGPAEVRVRKHARDVADMQEQGRDRVRHRRADAPEDAMPVHIGTGHLELVSELRRIAGTHFEEKDRLVRRQMMRIASLAKLAVVLLAVAGVRPVRDDADRPPRGFLQEPARGRVRGDRMDA